MNVKYTHVRNWSITIMFRKCIWCIFSPASIETVTLSLGKSFKWICKAQEIMLALYKEN